ncbi:CGNR zinc finger domain-containing protein [Pseudomonas sp. PDM03]|uniref:CGNR zinc finger domain-containing protein n=1 Tax=Pseudomonas sp. PDM03 TaxID=2769266 RepID=UPI00177F0E07|nr:CGNR zinc finger domain-containing protein [Pseudomonas sp. PDM03]MBD9585569.1 CGNR zinc finger domain-containing protein [Pseudomonas sp. PDM03]
MNSTPRGPALFVADAAALDFLNSIATPVDEPVDWIDDGNGWLDWLKQSGWVEDEILQRLQAQAMPGELETVAAQARSLREWFRGFVLKYKGQPLEASALTELEALNRLLERDEKYTQITLQDGETPKLAWELKRRWRSPDSLLLPLGEVLAQFVSEEDFTNVKCCEGPSCTLMFIDHTRGRKRRWCSMAVCGNRAKAAAHRERQKKVIDA